MRRHVVNCRPFHLNQGAAGDLLRRPVVRRIIALLRSGQLRGILAALPCTTFSQLRRPRLRSRQRPRGVQRLSDKDQARLDTANHLLYNLLVSLNLATDLGIA